MTGYIKESHRTILTSPTSCGKTHLVLNLTEKKLTNILTISSSSAKDVDGIRHIISGTGSKNKVWLIEPKDRLYRWIEKSSELLALSETFINNDLIADESLDKRRQSLLELVISGRHGNHYLWLLTQFYSAIQANLRRQVKAIFKWYPKENEDLKIIKT